MDTILQPCSLISTHLYSDGEREELFHCEVLLSCLPLEVTHTALDPSLEHPVQLCPF